MNQPADNSELVVFQIKLIENRSLAIIVQKVLLKNHLHVITPLEPIVQLIDLHIKYPLKYLAERQEHALELANEYTILKESKQREKKHLLYLDGTVFAGSFITLRLPYYELKRRDYLELFDILKKFQIYYFKRYKGSNNCIKWDVHKDFKHDNIMISFNNRQSKSSIRKDNSRFKTAQGTPGYFPFKENVQMEVSNGIYGLLLQQYQNLIQRKMNTMHRQFSRETLYSRSLRLGQLVTSWLLLLSLIPMAFQEDHLFFRNGSS